MAPDKNEQTDDSRHDNPQMTMTCLARSWLIRYLSKVKALHTSLSVYRHLMFLKFCRVFFIKFDFFLFFYLLLLKLHFNLLKSWWKYRELRLDRSENAHHLFEGVFVAHSEFELFPSLEVIRPPTFQKRL